MNSNTNNTNSSSINRLTNNSESESEDIQITDITPQRNLSLSSNLGEGSNPSHVVPPEFLLNNSNIEPYSATHLSQDNINSTDPNSINLKILSMDEKKFNISIDKESLVKDLKEKIQTESLVPANRQRLISKGKLLDDDKKLSSYSIKDQDVIHFIARLNNDTSNNNNTNLNDMDIQRENDLLLRDRHRERGNLNLFPFLAPMRRRVVSEVISNNDIGDNLTCIMQNNCTLSQMISNKTLQNNYSLEHFSGQNESKLNFPLEFIDFERREFTLGQWVDVKDTVNLWLEAKVVDLKEVSEKELLRQEGSSSTPTRNQNSINNNNSNINYQPHIQGHREIFNDQPHSNEEPNASFQLHYRDRSNLFAFLDNKEESITNTKSKRNKNILMIKVHYIGWGENWDEWIPSYSKRIMPFRYYTLEKFKKRACPSAKSISNVHDRGLFKETVRANSEIKDHTISNVCNVGKLDRVNENCDNNNRATGSCHGNDERTSHMEVDDEYYEYNESNQTNINSKNNRKEYHCLNKSITLNKESKYESSSNENSLDASKIILNENSDINLTNIFSIQESYINFMNDKVNHLRNLKNSIYYSKSNEENNAIIKNSQSSFYVTLKQLQPVLDRLGRNLCDMAGLIDKSIKKNDLKVLEPDFFKVTCEELRPLQRITRQNVHLDSDYRSLLLETNKLDKDLNNPIPLLRSQGYNNDVEIYMRTYVSEPASRSDSNGGVADSTPRTRALVPPHRNTFHNTDVIPTQTNSSENMGAEGNSGPVNPAMLLSSFRRLYDMPSTISSAVNNSTSSGVGTTNPINERSRSQNEAGNRRTRPGGFNSGNSFLILNSSFMPIDQVPLDMLMSRQGNTNINTQISESNNTDNSTTTNTTNNDRSKMAPERNSNLSLNQNSNIELNTATKEVPATQKNKKSSNNSKSKETNSKEKSSKAKPKTSKKDVLSEPLIKEEKASTKKSSGKSCATPKDNELLNKKRKGNN